MSIRRVLYASAISLSTVACGSDDPADPAGAGGTSSGGTSSGGTSSGGTSSGGTSSGGTAGNGGTIPANAEEDWNQRSTAPGVVWAQRFTTPESVNKFIVATDQELAKKYVKFEPSDGVLGDGCLAIDTPAGEVQSGSWGRPMQPIPGDINSPGLPVGPDFEQVTPAFVNWHGGHFAHQDYHSEWPDQCIGTDFYFQYRVKFSVGRFDEVEPGGKMLMIVTGYHTPSQEIVTTAKTSYGGGWFNMYTSVGSNFNSFLDSSQQQNQGASMQPGGPFDDTCVVGQNALDDNCWVFHEGEWATILIHVIPGHDHVNGDINDPANPHDTGIEVFAARAGETSYTKIWDKKDYVWLFDAQYIDGEDQPNGWNWLNFTAFTGGSVAVPSVNGYYHRHDQLIFSTQFIECPQF